MQESVASLGNLEHLRCVPARIKTRIWEGYVGHRLSDTLFQVHSAFSFHNLDGAIRPVAARNSDQRPPAANGIPIAARMFRRYTSEFEDIRVGSGFWIEI